MRHSVTQQQQQQRSNLVAAVQLTTHVLAVARTRTRMLDYASSCTDFGAPALRAFRDERAAVPFTSAAVGAGRVTGSLARTNSSWDMVSSSVVERNMAFVRGAVSNASSLSSSTTCGQAVYAVWSVSPVT